MVLLPSTTKAIAVVAMERRLVETIVCRARGLCLAPSCESAFWRMHHHHGSSPPFLICAMNFTTSKDSNNSSSSSSSSNNLLPHGSPQQWTTIYVHPLSQLVLASLQTHGHEWILRHELDRSLTIHRDGTFVLEPKPQQRYEMAEKNTCAIETAAAAAEGTITTAATTATTTTTTTERESLQPKVDATNGEGNNNAPSYDGDTVHTPIVSSDGPQPPLDQGRLRIWTSYDPVDKKHWLSVQLAAPPPAAKKMGVSAAAVAAAAAVPLTRENDPIFSSSSSSSSSSNTSNVLVRRFLLQDNLLPAWHGGGASRHKSLPERIQEMVDQIMILVDENYHMAARQQQQQQQRKQ